MKKIIGLGNAILDISFNVQDKDIQAMNLKKGSMQLADEKTFFHLLQTCSPTQGLAVAGGSCANTIAGLASFGLPAVFLGKVHQDASGAAFIKSMTDLGIHCPVRPLTKGPQTAQCLVLTTPDAERTMVTYLGACLELGPEDIEESFIDEASIVYLEGYLWDSSQAQQAFLKVSNFAKKYKKCVAFSSSDPFCVQRHREDFLNFIQENVQLLFANEEEARVLFQAQNFEDILTKARALKKTIVITRSGRGSVILDEQGHAYPVEAVKPIPQLVDTTGAGDLYAAGFLYGLQLGLPLATCGSLGSMAAAEVISHYGARPLVPLSQKV